MRQGDDALVAQRPVAGEIAHIIAQVFAVQSGDHRIFIDDRITRKVQQHRAGLHDRHTFIVDEIACRVQQRHMQRHEIAVFEQVFDAIRLLHLR